VWVNLCGGAHFCRDSCLSSNQQMNTLRVRATINPILYSMAATSPAAFHDITTGNNKVPCQAEPRLSNGGDIGYSAAPATIRRAASGRSMPTTWFTAWGSSGTLASRR